MSKNDLILENIPEVKKLIELGKINKEITYDEINDILPDKVLNSEKIDEIFILLNQLGVEVVEEITDKSLDRQNKKKKGSTSKKTSTVSTSSHTDDPIRLYLKEIGKVSLLSGDQEVDLAKRIEGGEILIENSVQYSPLLVNDLIKNYQKVTSGKIKLTDILKVNRLYYFSSIDMSELEKRYYDNMEIVIEKDNKILEIRSKLKKIDKSSDEADDLNEKINNCNDKIKNAIMAMNINENEINKLANKVRSMVKRVTETYNFFYECSG